MKAMLLDSILLGARRVSLVAGVLLALGSASSRAEARDEEAATTVSSCSAADVPLTGALVSPRLRGPTPPTEALAWDARFIVDVDASFGFRGGRILLAAPLPPGATLEPSLGVAAIVERDRVTGLCVGPEALRVDSISVSVRQAGVPAGRPVALAAPIAEGAFVQIIAPTATPDLRVDLNAEGPIERHVGFVAARGIDHAARERARRLVDMSVDPSVNPVYVRGDDVRSTGGLTGRLEHARARSRGSALAALVAFAGVVAALLLVARRLRHHASVERADALLAAEIDGTRGERS